MHFTPKNALAGGFRPTRALLAAAVLASAALALAVGCRGGDDGDRLDFVLPAVTQTPTEEPVSLELPPSPVALVEELWRITQ